MTVVALAFAEYALLETWLSRAGAAACVAGTTALLIGLAAVAVSASAGAAKKPPPAAPRSDALLDRAFEFVKEKPVVAIAAALAAGFLAVRNPGYLGAAVRSFLEGEPPPPRR